MRAQRDAHAKLHSCFLFLRALQPQYCSERLSFVNAAQQAQQEGVPGRSLPVHALAVVPSVAAAAAASSGSRGSPGGFAGSA